MVREASAKAISSALGTIIGRRMPIKELDNIIALSGSRHELLAYLIVNEGLLDEFPITRQALERQIAAVKLAPGSLSQDTSMPPPLKPSEEDPSVTESRLTQFSEPASAISVENVLLDMQNQVRCAWS